MKKCIVVFKPDGSVIVNHPIYKLKKDDENESQFLDRIYQKDLASVLVNPDHPELGTLGDCDYTMMAVTDLPDRTGGKRDKWRRDGTKKKIKIDNSVVTRPDRQKTIEKEIETEHGKSDEEMDVKKLIRLERQLKTGEY